MSSGESLIKSQAYHNLLFEELPGSAKFSFQVFIIWNFLWTYNGLCHRSTVALLPLGSANTPAWQCERLSPDTASQRNTRGRQDLDHPLPKNKATAHPLGLLCVLSFCGKDKFTVFSFATGPSHYVFRDLCLEFWFLLDTEVYQHSIKSIKEKYSNAALKLPENHCVKGWALWPGVMCTPVIQIFRRQRQEHHKLEAILDCTVNSRPAWAA